MTERSEKSGLQIKWLTFLLTVAVMIVSVTIYVTSRPSRDEVQQMIDKQTSQRLQRIEMQLDDINKDVKQILIQQGAKGR